ncbi:MAG: ABC transporter substrate-binding protein [Chloroflexota bacterium]|nr:ABC transporter substrate-binding protein [Chloroflexota bacterium]
MRRLTIPALLVTFGIVLAACGSSLPSGALASLGEGEGTLNLIIWDGYAEKGAVDKAYDWVTGFEADTGCKVSTTPMTDSANGVQLLQSGQYDGGSFSGDATIRLMAGGDVAPVNVDLIPNYKDVFPGLKLKEFNSKDGVPYGVPHGRGPNLLMWNTDVVKTAPTSWDPIFEGAAAYKGKISIYDSSIYIADAALHLMQKKPELGITNPYQLNDAQFAAAIDLLQKQHDNGVIYWPLLTDQVQSFGSGDTVIGTTWPYQVNLLKGEKAPVAAVLPAEGSTGWSDTWMISSKAAHPNCMYKWMNHMISPQANAEATIWFGEAAVTQKACDFAETILAGHCKDQHASDEAYWDKIWYWTTPQETCADTNDATKCKTQDDWVAAWTALRGA